MQITVVGSGSWGTALATVFAARGHGVTLLSRDPARAAAIERDRENARYLPGVTLDRRIHAGHLGQGIAAATELVVLAIPSRVFSATLAGLTIPPAAAILSLTKGLEPGSGQRLSDVAGQVVGDAARIAVLSGPNHAEEVARGTPAATVIASVPIDLAVRLRDEISSERFRVYANADLVGVELAGAAKNVIAVAAGVSDGLGLGDNAKAALVTRGLAEMTRLGVAFGADQRTFAGLAGLGDLVATCCSRHSRNRRAGELLAEGMVPAAIEAHIGMVAEGLTTAPTLRAVARDRGLELPITERVCALLEGEDPRTAVARLMAREPNTEY